MRKFIEKLVEGGFLLSGSVSSFTILLIIVFLFKEAAGLFNSPEVEEGYILAVNQENPVEHLSPEQIMDVFDANITNWEDYREPRSSLRNSLEGRNGIRPQLPLRSLG